MRRTPPSEAMKQEADAILDGYLQEGPLLEALAHLGARYMLQVALEEEVTAFLGRGHYQHGPHRQGGWRNGYQPVALRGPDGKWELFGPKVWATEDPFRSAWARRIRLGREDLQALVAGMYVRALSTRDIQDLCTQVFGQPVLSKSQVSRIAARLGPAFDTRITYKMLTYAPAGDFRHWICAIDVTKKAVCLTFLFGVLIDDPRGVLRAGTGISRTIDFVSVEEVHAQLVADYVNEAVSRLDYFKAHQRPL